MNLPVANRTRRAASELANETFQLITLLKVVENYYPKIFCCLFGRDVFKYRNHSFSNDSNQDLLIRKLHIQA